LLQSLSLSRWTKERDSLALVPTVDAKVIFVDCDDDMPGKQFAHTDQTEVRQIGLTVCIAQCEISKVIEVAFQVKRQTNNSIA
jgi:hypothetical protein